MLESQRHVLLDKGFSTNLVIEIHAGEHVSNTTVPCAPMQLTDSGTLHKRRTPLPFGGYARPEEGGSVLSVACSQGGPRFVRYWLVK